MNQRNDSVELTAKTPFTRHADISIQAHSQFLKIMCTENGLFDKIRRTFSVHNAYPAGKPSYASLSLTQISACRYRKPNFLNKMDPLIFLLKTELGGSIINLTSLLVVLLIKQIDLS